MTRNPQPRANSGSHARKLFALGVLLFVQGSLQVSGFAIPCAIPLGRLARRHICPPGSQCRRHMPQQLRCSDGGGEDDETEREQRLRKLGFSIGDAESDADRASSRARRAFLATTLSPLASVSLVYLAVPGLLSEKTRQADWYKSNFASKMGGMDDYEVHMQGLKENLFSLVRPDDVVVELGAGLGPNIDRLPTTISYTAVEPNKFMHEALSAKAGKHFVESLQEGESIIVEDMRLVPSDSADIVISTLVLCSVPGSWFPSVRLQESSSGSKTFTLVAHLSPPSPGPSPSRGLSE